ncbi:MAG: Desampylase [Methanonatronarchaeales archaeon]|nr:Desampylase [Methanonatronarchaeales archaeon]
MRIERRVFEAVKAHCEDEYPREGCGVLGGDPETGVVTSSSPVENAARHEGFDVYYMDPVEQLETFEALERAGLSREGFYHSHPDHGAYFSRMDRESALVEGEPLHPGETYLVLSVVDGKCRGASAFGWGGNGFVEEGFEVL